MIPGNLHETLSAPLRHQSIPSSAQWLAGEGAGSWFNLVARNELFEITRYSPDGKIECTGLFKNIAAFDVNVSYEFTYLSHCQQVKVVQNKKVIVFNRVG